MQNRAAEKSSVSSMSGMATRDITLMPSEVDKTMPAVMPARLSLHKAEKWHTMATRTKVADAVTKRTANSIDVISSACAR